MCSVLSCCHQPSANYLSVQLYYAARLLLANGSDELLPDQQISLETRLDSLWDQIQAVVELRYRVSAAAALNLTEQLLAQLLHAQCCRRSLRRAIPLEAALGPAALLA